VRVLLAEDNEQLTALLVSGLSKQGFEVDSVSSGSDCIAAVQSSHFSVVILDLGLPDGDGFTVLKRLRGQGLATPVLVLTARTAVGDRVKGLESGADDYLGKPFEFEELVARLRALLRRPATFVGAELTLGRLVFDPAAHELIVDGRAHDVAPREATVLELLMRRHDRVVPKKLIEDQLYGLSDDGSPNAVEVAVYRLRRQLGECDAGVEIHTIRGVGYLIKIAAT
jgi:DNA-binding response OmpR family regulator